MCGPPEGDVKPEAIRALNEQLSPAHLHYCRKLDSAEFELPLPAPVIKIVRDYAFDDCLFKFAETVLGFPSSVVAWRDIAAWCGRHLSSDARGRRTSIEHSMRRAIHLFESAPRSL